MNLLSPENKIMTLDQAIRWRAALKKDGKTLSITNGCFDLLHLGHAQYLIASRKLADSLLVLVNSDASVRSLKGPSRPVVTENDRAYLLACFQFVDAVVIFDSKRCNRELAALAPDFYAKGGDYTLDTLDPDERKAILDAGTQVAFLPFVAGHSTTNLINKAAEK